MNTFVRREILDNSISGDKIFGGSINYVDGLYTDHLAVPHDAGSGGTGSIDGAAFTIGITDRIAFIDAVTTNTRSLNVWASDFSGYAATLTPTSTQYGTLYLNSASGHAVQLTANSSSYSYHTPKLIIGATSEQASHYKFEVPSHFSYFYGIDCLMAICTNLQANSFYFINHSALWTNIQDVSQLVDYLATNALSGGVGPLLVDPLQEIVDNISAWQMSQIAHLQDAISTSNWQWLSEMDQSVSIGQQVIFGDVDCINVIATGDVAAAGQVEGTKLVETSGGTVLVPSQHGDIRGLHLDWFYPLGVSTETRIIVEEGECIDASKVLRISLTSRLTKHIDALWIAGDDNGGRAGPLTSSTYYWVHVIYNSSGGLVDAGFDTSLTATNLLSVSSYTHYRTLGRVRVDGADKIIMFEDIATYQYTHRSTRSGFKLGVGAAFVSSPFEVYSGAQRLGRTVECWIQEGSEPSNSSKLEYNFFPYARPLSLDTYDVVAAPCNFLNGNTASHVKPGEIRLDRTSDTFQCLCFIDGAGIHEDGFVLSGPKGIQQLISFIIHIRDHT